MKAYANIIVPAATLHNRVDYCAAYIARWGGDARNAFRVWQVECLDNLRTNISVPFPPVDALKKAGLFY